MSGYFGVGAGFGDFGALWVESCAVSGFLFALLLLGGERRAGAVEGGSLGEGEGEASCSRRLGACAECGDGTEHADGYW